MNRATRRKEAKKLGIPMPKGVKVPAIPTFREVYIEKERKSAKGITYKVTKKVRVPTNQSLLQKIFSK